MVTKGTSDHFFLVGDFFKENFIIKDDLSPYFPVLFIPIMQYDKKAKHYFILF